MNRLKMLLGFLFLTLLALPGDAAAQSCFDCVETYRNGEIESARCDPNPNGAGYCAATNNDPFFGTGCIMTDGCIIIMMEELAFFAPAEPLEGYDLSYSPFGTVRSTVAICDEIALAAERVRLMSRSLVLGI
jgi:hypothetical protein